MTSIWQEYNIQIVSGIISFVVATLTTFVTYFVGQFRLRSAERVKLVSALTNEKLQAIDDIRKKIIVLKEYEDLSITENFMLLFVIIVLMLILPHVVIHMKIFMNFQVF